MTDTPEVQPIAGRCPACGSQDLILGTDEHITCDNSRCPNRAAASELLFRSPFDGEYVITVTVTARTRHGAYAARRNLTATLNQITGWEDVTETTVMLETAEPVTSPGPPIDPARLEQALVDLRGRNGRHL